MGNTYDQDHQHRMLYCVYDAVLSHPQTTQAAEITFQDSASQRVLPQAIDRLHDSQSITFRHTA